MATITGSKVYEILPGVDDTEDEVITIISSPSAGTPGARRILTHPDGANFPPVSYDFMPTRTINLDNDVLYVPSTSVIETLGTTLPFRAERGVDDVIVTEIWTGGGKNAAMTSAFARRLYELFINTPALASPEVFITWEPKDRNTYVYNVVILDLRIGGQTAKLDWNDLRDRGGIAWGGSIANALDDIDAVATGVVDKTVELDLKIVSKVP